MKELLLDFARYNYWANKRILDILADIPGEILDTELKSSFPTIRKTVLHMWDAQVIWIKRLNGSSLDYWPSRNFEGSIDELSVEFLKSSQDHIDFISDASPEKISANIFYKNLKGDEFIAPCSQIILHCMNHATFHRGQIITMLRELGFGNFPSTDYIVFTREK